MFKVSLLPASYRKFLDGKKKKDLILKVALIVLLILMNVAQSRSDKKQRKKQKEGNE